VRGTDAEFARAKRVGIAALTAGMLQWFIAFLCVGAEWFLMWQSKTWNGQEAAFRMFAVEGILLVILMLPEPRES
jgi:predicted small integral membrane protein